MNTYKITYIVDEGESAEAYVTERSEAAARKALKKSIGNRSIVDVELHETDVCATKAQERETLAKIKEMVEELGPRSYIATALAGCLDDAEDNIREDAAYSMKDRYDSAQEEVEALRSKVKSLEAGIDELVQKDDERKAALEELKKKQLPNDLYSAIYDLAQGEHDAARQRMERAAEIMAEMGDTPQDIAFGNAVKEYRSAKTLRATCETILKGLEALTE